MNDPYTHCPTCDSKNVSLVPAGTGPEIYHCADCGRNYEPSQCYRLVGFECVNHGLIDENSVETVIGDDHNDEFFFCKKCTCMVSVKLEPFDWDAE